ncbi:unnamed protein product [Rotaria magnacalcarata]|uniref:Uncharacterized protein n=1 Tax=Rotaria magnacalcarata TaxID=392030 RepID=A0A816TU62_9BILA|nr:unnamed protein product [Rotaria magnacalcarata]
MVESIHRTLLIICKLLFITAIVTDASSEQRSKQKADQTIRDICEKLDDDDLSHMENEKWLILCEDWIKTKNIEQYDVVQDETILDGEPNTISKVQLTKARGNGGIRITGGGSRISGSRSPSSISRFRNTRTGTSISRPNGWLWSRSRLVFLPLATLYFHRSRSASNRYTTPPSTSLTYYYCTSNDGSVEIQCTSISRPNGWLWSRSRLVFLPLATLYFHRSRSASNRYTTPPSTSLTYYYCTSNDGSVEIQCSSMYGDTLCCEDQTSQQPFCCGGDIPDDFVEDPNRATRRLAKIFYTLTAITLCIHLFLRRLRQ